MAHAAPLLTPRQFLTNLINSLPEPSAGAPTSNPLRDLKYKERSLLTTLHVFFPTPILLPALDLLDRQLVTRIIQIIPPAESRPTSATILADPEPRDQNDWRNTNHFFLVTSASDLRGKGGGHGGGKHSSGMTAQGQGQGQTYVVRTEAWNCSCAAFTFSAFPASMSPFSTASDLEDSEIDGSDMRIATKRELDSIAGDLWEFGGMSCDGKIGGQVPCCKHLLACVLVERWEAVLGRYVVEKRVEREEMAGMGAGVG